MPNYRRSREGTAYFFTVLTYRRRPILCLDESPDALRAAIREARMRLPFAIDAWVLLPDHLHCIWTLPEGGADYSTRWGLMKAGFTRRVARTLADGALLSASRRKHRDGAPWQRRFWEHTLRDERDFAAHCDSPAQTRHPWRVRGAPIRGATFHRFAERGLYPKDWGSEPPELPAGMGRE